MTALALTSPATRADVIALLLRGSRPAATLRLFASDMQQLTRGFSYTLREDGVVLGVAGFWPVDNPPPALAEAAAGRALYMLWLIAGAGLAPHLARVVHLARGFIARLAAGGALVVADLDGEQESAARLARLC